MAGSSVRLMTDPERIAGIEQAQKFQGDEIDSLRRTVEGGFANIERKFGDLASAVSISRTTPWGLVIGFSGLIFTLIGGACAVGGTIGTLALNNLSSQLSTTSAESRSNADMLQRAIEAERVRANEIRRDMDVEHSKYVEKMREVETQLRAQSNYANIRGENMERWLNELWVTEFGHSLQPAIVWPVVGDRLPP